MNTKSKNQNNIKNDKLSVKNNAVFKLLFCKKDNEEFIKDFLSNLLKMDIKEIEVDIEIQLKDYDNMIQRATFYSTRMISSQLVKGDDYKLIKPVIVVVILNFDVFKFDEYIISALVLENHREYTIDTL